MDGLDHVTNNWENRPLRMRYCPSCGDPGATYNRQMTAYANDASNYAWACDPCQKDLNEYWDEMWRDYYAGVLC